MKHSTRILTAALAVAFATQFAGAVPVVSSVDMNQSSKRVVITYTLSEEPAVVTLDVQTNANTSATADDPGWTSIGGAAVCNAQGDVWKKVETGNRTITWRPDQSWPDHVIADGGARAVVTAWSLGNTPDYMVVDISAAAKPNTQRYYQSVDFLPGSELGQTGAITNNSAYKTTKLVMRKIMAKDVEWVMGSIKETGRDSRENARNVTLANNYYMGVFEVTQAQWALVVTNKASSGGASAYFTADGSMRPMEQVCYNEIRTTANSTTANADYYWPADPNPVSFLGLLRLKTGIDFDLPSEAQWEFAARAGHGEMKWPDGADMYLYWKAGNRPTDDWYDDHIPVFTRCKHTYPTVAPDSAVATTRAVAGGTAIVGSYKPNDWGLYDTAGNVFEWVLDWYQTNIAKYNGQVNINPSNPSSPIEGSASLRVMKGGDWRYVDTRGLRPASCSCDGGGARGMQIGFRVCCTAGLQ